MKQDCMSVTNSYRSVLHLFLVTAELLFSQSLMFISFRSTNSLVAVVLRQLCWVGCSA